MSILAPTVTAAGETPLLPGVGSFSFSLGPCRIPDKVKEPNMGHRKCVWYKVWTVVDAAGGLARPLPHKASEHITFSLSAPRFTCLEIFWHTEPL